MKSATVKRESVVSSRVVSASECAANVVASLGKAELKTIPYRHWLVTDMLSLDLCHEILALPIAPAAIEDTYGKRDSHNDIRRFFSPDSQARFPVMKTIAEAFQSASVVRTIEKLCDLDLKGSYLRIEYCQDRNGFWLEPHMDIKEKFITMQFYLNTGTGAETLGTDLYDAQKKYFSSAPSALGQGMIFVPKEPESWHGFEKRTIPDVRRSLIINYVTDDWRSRHELSFPEQKVI